MKKLIILLMLLIAVPVFSQTDVANPVLGAQFDFGVIVGDYHPQSGYGISLSLPYLDFIGLNKPMAIPPGGNVLDTNYSFSIVGEMTMLKSKFAFDQNSDLEAAYAGIVARKTFGWGSTFADFGGGLWKFVDAEGADDKDYLGYNVGFGAKPGGVFMKLAGHIIPINDSPDMYGLTFSLGLQLN